jgi:serine/threonine-protein kinase RsbW
VTSDAALVTLTIPCAPEYVGMARLTIMSVASRMGFAVDMIEDIRMAVGEACTNAIERSERSKNGTEGGAKDQITIRSRIEPSRLLIEVEDHIAGGEGTEHAPDPGGDIDLYPLLMGILVDEVTIEPLAGGGTQVRLVKYANPDSEASPGDAVRSVDELT